MKLTQEERAGNLARAILRVGDKTLEHVFSRQSPNFPSLNVKIALIAEDDNLTLRLIINKSPTELKLTVEDHYDDIGLRPRMVFKARMLMGSAVQYLIGTGKL